jgi:hypothetical protein
MMIWMVFTAGRCGKSQAWSLAWKKRKRDFFGFEVTDFVREGQPVGLARGIFSISRLSLYIYGRIS